MNAQFTASAAIKLVIWDLDDTFWKGTLSEEGVELIEDNIAIVRALLDRGIMSSIVSKNDMGPVRKVLEAASLWDLFIFPRVAWSPKGSLIQEIVEEANLRPDNVLFIDDNSINAEEARFRFPTMMVAYPQDVLPVLLDCEAAKGKDDRDHSRLRQYKRLEQKVVDRTSSALSNVDFLRQCDIQVRFEYDVRPHLERIVELINRSNQLNYTKVRIEDQAARSVFEDMLDRHDIFAAGIFASDRYGSHGLIGFYLQQRNERSNRLIHYVWSCRMMNAGLEQYVFEKLGSPDIDVVTPVSNPIIVFDEVDWIRESQDELASAPSMRLLLLGSCDLTAVASYCSGNRTEFVNGVRDGIMVRYDDFGFILGDRDKVHSSNRLRAMPTWRAEDFDAFHEALPRSEVLILSLSAALKGLHGLTADGVAVRVHPEGLGHAIDFDPGAGFLKGMAFYDHDLEQRIAMLEQALAKIESEAAPGSRKFLLGANTRDVNGDLTAENAALLARHNAVCERFCETRADWNYVSIDAIVPKDCLTDDRHYTRLGYLMIAQYINERVASERSVSHDHRMSPRSARDIVDMVRAGRRVSRLTTFGRQSSGLTPYLKQALKMTGAGKLVRKIAG